MYNINCRETCDDDNNCTMTCETSPIIECEDDETCTPECPNDCTSGCDENGVCNSDDPKDCSHTCPDGCDESGNCIIACPESCPNDCIDGVCQQPPEKCLEECPDECDEFLVCPNKCPDECPNDCDDDGVCPVTCKSYCTTTCDEKDNCQCSESCTTSCDKYGVCQCPESCTTSCDKNGVCQCPKSCTTSCDKNGVCKCPSSCSGKCDENGECPAMCGNEIIESFKFGHKELDLIDPAAVQVRNKSATVLYIKTNKKTYNISDAPCKDKITLKSTDTNVLKVGKSSTGCSVNAVGVGTADCVATLKGTNLKASVKVHVLNPKNLTNDLSKKVNGKYIHLYQGPLSLKLKTRVSQGFDFYNKDYIYFSQLKYGVTLEDGTKLDHNASIIFKHLPGDKNTDPMRIFGAGHAQNICIETGKKDYVWIGNYGTLLNDEKNNYDSGYKQSQTISRIEYKEGAELYPDDEAVVHYYYKDKLKFHSLEPALDQKNNKLAIRANSEDDKILNDYNTHIKIFSLSKAKALKAEKIDLPRKITTVKEASGGKYKIVGPKTVQVTAKNLAELTSTEIIYKNLPVQGLEYENGIFYAVGGMPKNNVNGQYLYNSKILLKMFVYDSSAAGHYKEIGSYYLQTTAKNDGILINKDLDGIFKQSTSDKDYFNVGYFEPEGIRVSNGVVYISVTTHLGYREANVIKDTPRRQIIFSYDLMAK